MRLSASLRSKLRRSRKKPAKLNHLSHQKLLPRPLRKSKRESIRLKRRRKMLSRERWRNWLHSKKRLNQRLRQTPRKSSLRPDLFKKPRPKWPRSLMCNKNTLMSRSTLGANAKLSRNPNTLISTPSAPLQWHQSLRPPHLLHPHCQDQLERVPSVHRAKHVNFVTNRTHPAQVGNLLASQWYPSQLIPRVKLTILFSSSLMITSSLTWTSWVLW